MSRTKDPSEDLRSRTADLHDTGKGQKSIALSLDVHVSMVGQTVYKWCTFGSIATPPQRGRPLKITVRAERRMLIEMKKKKNPRVSGVRSVNLWHVPIFLLNNLQ